MAELAKQRALITGAAEGIGWAIAQVFEREGAELVLLDNNEELIREKQPLLPRAEFLRCDVADLSALERVVLHATSGRRLHTLILNAAVGSYAGTAENLKPEEWDRVMGVNLKGAWYLAKLLIPHFRAHGGGTIIVINSIHREATYSAHFPYNVSKGGLTMLVRALALDYGKDGIRALGIAPGWIRTRNNERFLETVKNKDRVWEMIRASHPLGRIGEPQEVGELASFIASPRCPFLNGTTITLDGGLTAALPADISFIS